MIVSVLAGVLILLSATFLGVAEKALGPDISRFPCINEPMRWVLRVYTLALFIRSVVILTSLTGPNPRLVPWDLVFCAAMMCAAHGVLLKAILEQRLPSGLWMRLQARQDRVRRLAQGYGSQGQALAALAAEGVRVIAPGEGPEAVQEAVVLH
ncbi:holin/antiholin [Caulobacter phage Sansa]|uniref:Holin/antiholin n=1 Tax=Caulobacter phage Sansa TaxID=1675600 RepID=A0A0K1LLR8_9CAUD|nr:holin/antiholin [Caulobacter phage Sansa]AKU43452.1 holin/antiholin [Caulobacter phage Sansa]